MTIEFRETEPEREARYMAIADERARQQRHHDVLCLVLKELVRQNGKPGECDIDKVTLTMIARSYADLAYPPPKPGEVDR
jgi:hypothetical protein